MSGFTREWVRFLFGVVALALVSICTREAKAFPGLTNVNGTAGAGYITSAYVESDPSSATPAATLPVTAGCIGCHGDFSDGTGFGRETWAIGSVAPALAISGAGTGTTHGTNTDGTGGIFTVQPGHTATFTLTFKTFSGTAAAPTNGGSGGFLVYHKDGTGNSSGTLIPVGGEHACNNLNLATDPSCGAGVGTIPGNNTEVMHAFPQTTGSGVTFTFHYSPPAVCSGSFGFRLWFNAENADSNCGAPDSAYHFDFTINIASC